MATQTIQFVFRTGLSPVVRLFADDGSDTILATPTATEATNRTGLYTFTQTDRAAGDYLITVSASGLNAVYRVTLTLTTAYFNASDLSLVDNVAEIQSGLSTLSEANIRTAVGLASANLDAQLTVIDDYLDTEIAAIKAKTDNLPAAFPSNFAALGINASGHVSRVTLVDTTTTNTDMRGTDSAYTGTPPTASDIRTEIDSNSTQLAAIKVVTDKYGSMVVVDGLVYQFTANALELGPSGAGSSVYVYPLNASMPTKVSGPNITFYLNEVGTVIGPIQVTRRNGSTTAAVDLSGKTLEVRIVDYLGTELETITAVTVSGVSDDQFEFEVTTATTGTVTGEHEDEWHLWSLRDVTGGDDNVLVAGKARVLLA